MEADVISTDGSVQEWDANWRALASHLQQLYHAGTPRTIVQFWHQCYFEDLWDAMGESAPNARYVELGSGRGTTSMYLSSRGCSVTMVDLSTTAFHLANDNFRREGLQPPVFVTADARKTNLPNSSFDCVLNIGLLEHFEDPKPVLTEAMRLLKPGGLLFMVIVPARADGVKWLVRMLLNPWRLGTYFVRKAARGARQRPAQVADTLYRTAYTREDYQTWLRELGAEGIECIPYNPYHSVYRRDALNRNVALPLYRMHHTVKRYLSACPRLKTFASTAMCDLLTGRKPHVA